MGLGQLLTRAATGQRITITPVIDGTDQPSVSTFVATNNLNVLSGGGSVSSWDAGMSIPGAWRATQLIADLLAALPYVPYRLPAEPDGTPERLRLPPVLEQPHPPELRFNTLHSWLLDAIWNGNAVGLVADRNAESWPTRLSPVLSDYVQVGRSRDTGRITYRVGENDYYDYQDVFHVKGPHKPGELKGKGVLQAHVETLTLARDQRRQAGSITNHGVPTGIIRSTDPKMNDTKAADLKKKWMDAQATRQPMMLNPQTDFEPISWNPEELQLVEARRLSTEELALIFGLPGYYLNVENSSRVYSNVSAENLQLLRFSSVRGWLARFEGALSGLLPRGTVVTADLDETLLRPDIVTRYQVYRRANATDELLSGDEIRRMEGRRPLPPKPAPPAPAPGEPPPEGGAGAS